MSMQGPASGESADEEEGESVGFFSTLLIEMMSFAIILFKLFDLASITLTPVSHLQYKPGHANTFSDSSPHLQDSMI